jgi:hypothetical protein
MLTALSLETDQELVSKGLIGLSTVKELILERNLEMIPFYKVIA